MIDCGVSRMPRRLASSAVAAKPESPRRDGRQEAVVALTLFVLGLLPRLAMSIRFPTRPISDFARVVDFALALRDRSWFAPGYYWDTLNVGPAIVLSLVFRVFPSDPAATARLATAVWTATLPLLPFLFWRSVLPRWVRGLAGLLLALWPGQVLFAGVVAQDNWALPPTVAAGALVVRALLRGRGYPVAAGLLFAVAVAMRQEMLVVLLLPFIASAGLLRREGWRWRPSPRRSPSASRSSA
jgi:predicted membrane-bound mannosyltransferase